MIYLAIFLGGAIGSIARFYLSSLIQKSFSITFPLGTFVINTTGAFLIGFLMAFFTNKLQVNPNLRAFFITGFLGGYTTFSTFMFESLGLLKDGNYLYFIYYFLGSNLVGLILVFIGFYIGSMI